MFVHHVFIRTKPDTAFCLLVLRGLLLEVGWVLLLLLLVSCLFVVAVVVCVCIKMELLNKAEVLN